MYQVPNGFTVIEILFSFALLALVFTPVLGVMNMLYTNHNTHIQDMFNVYISKGISGVVVKRVTNGDGKVCPAFESTLQMTVYTSNDIAVGTSTQIVALKAIGGQLLLGLDSSEVKDSDLALFSVERMKVLSEIDFSPGTKDTSISGTKLFAIHSGVVSDLSVTNIYPELHLQKSCVLKTDRRDGRSAQAVQVLGDRVVVGFEKNDGPELFLTDADCKILQTMEFGFGVHDIYVVDNTVYVLGPANPELFAYKLIDGKLVYVNELDVPGESGNARSLDYTGKGYVFGRSRGNEELVFLDNGLKVVDTAKIGSSVDKIISGTSTLVLLTSNKERELQIFKDNKLLQSMDLPARAHDGVCLGGKLYIGSMSTSSALIVVQEV